MTWDVVLYADTKEGAFAPEHNASKPTGGTEVHMVQLAEGLAAAGYGVTAISPISEPETTRAGYRCMPSAGNVEQLRCRALVTAGLSKVPEWIKPDRAAILWTHDPPHNLPFLVGHRWQRFVCVSEWQARRFPHGWDTAVIPAMIDEWIYELPPLHKDRQKFVCMSAWWKGTADTLLAWEQMRPPGATLYVGSPYSHPPNAPEVVRATPGCQWVDLKSPKDVVEAMRDAAGVFRVALSPETFGATDAIAQILGCRTHVLCPHGEMGALPATLGAWNFVTSDVEKFKRELHSAYLAPPVEMNFDRDRYLKNYRPAAIIPQWVKLLGLE